MAGKTLSDNNLNTLMKRIALFIVLALFGVETYSQNFSAWLDSLNVTPYGYVKLDAFYDTREVVSGREGHFLLWPAPAEYDTEGNDLNANSSFNMLAVQTNFGL